MVIDLLTGLSVLILVAVITLGVAVRKVARQMPGPEDRELARIRGEGDRAQLEMVRITSEGIQAMLDAALGCQAPRE